MYANSSVIPLTVIARSLQSSFRTADAQIWLALSKPVEFDGSISYINKVEGSPMYLDTFISLQAEIGYSQLGIYGNLEYEGKLTQVQYQHDRHACSSITNTINNTIGDTYARASI